MAELPVDAGLQAERTVLAWRRTQVALLVLACLAWRGGMEAVAGMALLSALLARARERSLYYRGLAMLRSGQGWAAVRIVPLSALVVTGLTMAVWLRRTA